MKHLLEQWSGKFLIDHEIKDTLDDVVFKDGDNIRVRLLAKRKETKDVKQVSR